MSSKFNWDQFQSVDDSSKSSGFNWEEFQTSDGLRKNKVPEMKRELGRAAKVVGSTLVGMPGDISQLAQKIPKFLSEKITGQQLPEGIDKSIRDLSPFGQLPTSEEITQDVEQFAPDLAPKNEQEKEFEENLSLLASILTPGPKSKAAAAFVDPKKASQLYRAGRSLGLTAEQLTPLFQGESKSAVLGKFAKKTPVLKRSFASTEAALSDAYSGLKEQAGKLPRFRANEANKLIDKFEDIKISLEKTLQPSPDKKAAISFIDGAIEKANNFGTSPEELLNFYQDINLAVNWNAIRGGKKVLGQLKIPIKDVLNETHPDLWKKFEDTNQLWGRLKNIEKKIGLPKIEKYIQLGEGLGLLTGLAFGNVGAILPAASTFAGRRIATKLLTDPKWQSLHKKALHAIKTENVSLGNKTLQIIKEKTKKELPEEYEEIEWPD